MDHDLKWIRQELTGFGERKAGFRYPEVFRRRVVRYAERRLKQTTTTGISREVGIPWVTIKRWRVTQLAEDEPVAVDVTPQAMVPVRVTGLGSDSAMSSVAVVTPSGWRVEGLTLSQVAELLGRCA